MDNMKPIVIAVCGKSCSGKNYYMNQIHRKFCYHINNIVDDTTRPIRKNEKQGIDYNFIDLYSFLQNKDDNKYLEIAYFNGWCYGTPKGQIEQDKINVGVFSPQGLKSLLKVENQYNIVVIYCEANFIKRFVRYIKREKKVCLELFRRFKNDRQDFRNINSLLECFSKVCIVKNKEDLKESVEKILDVHLELLYNEKELYEQG